MSEPIGGPRASQPSLAPAAAPGRTRVSGPAEPTGKLSPGMQVEIRGVKTLSPSTIEVRIQSSDPRQTWTLETRAQLAKPISESVAQQLASAGSGAARPLRAEVVTLSPALVLRLMEARADTMPAAGARAWIGQQLRQHWPASQPLAQGLEALAARVEQTGDRRGPIPVGGGAAEPVLQAVKSILGGVSSHHQLTDAEQLGRALGGSGIWLEAKLAQAVAQPDASAHLGSDLKAQLLSLAALIRSASLSGRELGTPKGPAAGRSEPAETAMKAPALQEPGLQGLARDLDGMLKQVVTHQLQSLSASSQEPHWLLELPFRAPTGLITLQTDIRREGSPERPDEAQWTTSLRLDLPTLGPLRNRLTLRGERLTASLQAGTARSADLIKDHLADLRAQLESQSIQVASLHAGHRPPEPDPPPLDTPLISEEA